MEKSKITGLIAATYVAAFAMTVHPWRRVIPMENRKESPVTDYCHICVLCQ